MRPPTEAPYFFRDLGRTVANGMLASGRPASSAMTKTSGTSGIPLLIASAKSSRVASTASFSAADKSGSSVPSSSSVISLPALR